MGKDVTRHTRREVGWPKKRKQWSVIKEGQAQWVSADPERWVELVGGRRLHWSSVCFPFVTVMGSNTMS